MKNRSDLMVWAIFDIDIPYNLCIIMKVAFLRKYL